MIGYRCYQTLIKGVKQKEEKSDEKGHKNAKIRIVVVINSRLL